MEKVVLRDGTEIEICNGAVENCITATYSTLEDVAVIVGKLTEDNLEEYKILNSAGLECCTLTNKCLESFTVYPNTSRAVFNLVDVDMIAKRLAGLEETQELQDAAITELAEMAVEQEE